jgi:hypothetical protein
MVSKIFFGNSSLFFFVIISVFLALNIFTPLVVDDYIYSLLGKDGGHAQSIFDILNFCKSYYLDWGGRIISHFFAAFWLFVGKPLFNIANTTVYIFFILLLQFHSTGSIKKINVSLFVLINVALWFLVRAWGQVFLWLDGSCNYLWTTTLVLLFLVPFRKKSDDANYNLNSAQAIGFFVLSLLAGCSNENTGIAVLISLLGYFAIKIFRKERILLFEIVGFIGFLIGYSVLVFAPGNEARFVGEGVTSSTSLFKNGSIDIKLLIYRFYRVTLKFAHRGGLLLFIVSLFAGTYILTQKKKIKIFTFFFLVAGFISAYSLIAVPPMSDRAYFPMVVFLFITALNLLIQIKESINLPLLVKKLFWCSVCVIFAVSFIYALKDMLNVYTKFKERADWIISQREKGVLDNIEVTSIVSYNKHCALYEQEGADVGSLVYRDNIAKYYKVNSLKPV